MSKSKESSKAIVKKQPRDVEEDDEEAIERIDNKSSGIGMATIVVGALSVGALGASGYCIYRIMKMDKENTTNTTEMKSKIESQAKLMKDNGLFTLKKDHDEINRRIDVLTQENKSQAKLLKKVMADNKKLKSDLRNIFSELILLQKSDNKNFTTLNSYIDNMCGNEPRSVTPSKKGTSDKRVAKPKKKKSSEVDDEDDMLSRLG